MRRTFRRQVLEAADQTIGVFGVNDRRRASCPFLVHHISFPLLVHHRKGRCGAVLSDAPGAATAT